jgi:hypothetical protein
MDPAQVMCIRIRTAVIPCIRTLISASKVIITIFFTGTQLVILNPWPKSLKFNQEYFTEQVLLSLSKQKKLNRRKKAAVDFVLHMDSSMYHNARKISLELGHNRIERAPHPAYSPDVSPCNF